MSEDIVDFSATKTAHQPRERRRLSMNLPISGQGLARPLAIAGGVLGTASAVAPWQRITEASQSRLTDSTDLALTAMLPTVGTFGLGYLITLIGSIACLALIFYGQMGVRSTARLIGLVLAGSSLIILAAAAYSLSLGTTFYGLFFAPSSQQEWKFTLDWGLWSAFGAVAATGVALWYAPVGEASEPAPAPELAEQEEEPDDRVIDLSVSVHPIRNQVA